MNSIEAGHQERNKLYKRLHKEWLICSAILCGIAIIISIWGNQLGLQRVNNYIYDSSMQLWPAKSIDDKIKIIAIDDYSIDKLGYWPWPRSMHANLLNQLNLADVVIFDILFTESIYINNQHATNISNDVLLAQAIKKHGRVILPEALDDNGIYLLRPINILADAAIATGRIDAKTDNDGVLRQIELWRNYQSNSKQQPIPHISIVVNSVVSKTDRTNYANIDGATYKIDFNGPPGHYQIYSYVDVLSNKVQATEFKDKIVLIGTWATGIGDSLPTAISKSPMAGVEILANTIHNAQTNSWIRQPGLFVTAIFNALIVLTICILIRKGSLKFNLIQPYIAIILFIIFDAISMHLFDYWLPPAGFVFALVITYPLWSWRSQEANLKYIDKQILSLDNSNIKDTSNYPDTLSSRASRLINAISLIRQQTKDREETLSFLLHDMRAPQSTILSSLELRKIAPDKYTEAKTNIVIEAQAKITLNLIEDFLKLIQARYSDLSLEHSSVAILLDNCISDMAIAADRNDLQIKDNLDIENKPYLALIDQSLLSRAIRNLLFNAISYSTKNTTINVSLNSIDTMLSIEVQNTGPIIPQEQIESIFTSFHRGEQGKSMDNKGVGLGLAFVLTAVRRHGGKVICQSNQESGTTFKILIPDNLTTTDI